MQEKKRILIPINGQGSVVHLLRTGIVADIAKYMQPVLLLYWQDKEFESELLKNGYEVLYLENHGFSPNYYRLYDKINAWYEIKLNPHKSIQITSSLHKKYNTRHRKVKSRLKDLFYKILAYTVPEKSKQWIANEDRLMKTEKPYLHYKQWMIEQKIDALYTVAPFLQEINLMGRVLNDLGKPALASIHSFDNVTKRKWQPFIFDHYFVWNKFNLQELISIYPALKNTTVSITGAPQFDFHFRPEYILPKQEWLSMMGLPNDKKIILYAGGAAVHFPAEPQYAAALCRAIEKGNIDNNTVILLRSHPLCNIERWKDFIGSSPAIFYYQPTHGVNKNNYSNVSITDIKILVSTLFYCDVHISLCSSMTIDGSIFQKPQIAPYYDNVNKAGEPALKAIYTQKHFESIVASGVLQFADSEEMLVSLVNKNLNHPQHISTCKKCVEDIITFTDGESTQRVAKSLASLLTNEDSTRHS